MVLRRLTPLLLLASCAACSLPSGGPASPSSSAPTARAPQGASSSRMGDATGAPSTPALNAPSGGSSSTTSSPTPTWTSRYAALRERQAVCARVVKKGEAVRAASQSGRVTEEALREEYRSAIKTMEELLPYAPTEGDQKALQAFTSASLTGKGGGQQVQAAGARAFQATCPEVTGGPRKG